MITSFELKNRGCCRSLYKIPYFIKNIILLFLLGCILAPTYLYHMKRGQVNVNTVYRMIAGLNSETFDYLQHRRKELHISDTIKTIHVQRATQVDFYMSCVSVSKPCLFNGMAKEWLAYSKWSYKN